MIPKIASDSAKSARTIAQQAAKQIFQEPGEIVKSGAKQVAGIESTPNQQPTLVSSQQPEGIPPENIESLRQQDLVKSRGLMDKLQGDLKAIRDRAQQEKMQKEATQQNVIAARAQAQTLVEPNTRRSRNILKGMGKKLSDLKKRAEIRMPPSG